METAQRPGSAEASAYTVGWCTGRRMQARLLDWVRHAGDTEGEMDPEGMALAGDAATVFVRWFWQYPGAKCVPVEDPLLMSFLGGFAAGVEAG